MGQPFELKKKCFTNILLLNRRGTSKGDAGETLLDAVTAGDHLNMDIQMEEGNFTLCTCLCNRQNNSIHCVKHISQLGL